MRRRFEHHGAAGRQRRADLAGDHGAGEIPRRNGGSHAHRLLLHQNALVAGVRRDHIAVQALALLGEPFEKGCGVGHFPTGLGQRFALFGRHDARQVFLVFQHQPVPTTQTRGALLGGQRPPGGLRRLCGFNGAAGFGAPHVGHLADEFAGGWVEDSGPAALVGIAPHAV